MADTATRPTRAEETRRARRMKPGSVIDPSIKLGLDETKLDRKTYEYRWVNDVPGRVRSMTTRDWDLVDEPEAKTDGTGVGTIPTQHGGIGENGRPYGMVLMRKFKDWHESDQKKRRAPLDDADKAIRRGTAHKSAGEAELADDVTYTPGTNAVDIR